MPSVLYVRNDGIERGATMSPDRTRSAGSRRRRSALWVGAAFALVVPLAGCGSTDQNAEAAGGKAGGSVAADPVVLRLLNPYDASSWEVFADEVDKVSQGQLRIEAVDHWNPDNLNDVVARDKTAVEAVRSGEFSLGIVVPASWPSQGVTSFEALYAPLLIDRPELQTAVLHSDVAGDMLKGLETAGITGVGILQGEMAHPAGFGHPLVGVDDYRGASVIAPPNDVVVKWFEALGVDPVPYPTQEDMDSGAIDGTVDRTSGVPGDYATSFTANVTAGPRPFVVYGNTQALDGLSQTNRQALLDAAAATIDVQAAGNQAHEADDAGVLCRSGTIAFEQADPAQLAALRAASEPVYQWLREDSATAGFLDRIQQIAEATPVDPANVLSCATAPRSTASSPASATAPGPVDGTFTWTTTKDDLEASGVPTDWIVPENWGESVFVLDRGRFATTQHNDLSCTWAYGRFSIDGDTITLDYQGGGGQSPTGAATKPGEELIFDWSLYRDVLTLTHHEGGISPVPEGQQWPLNRISAIPDPSALNQQCPPPAAAFAN